MNRKPRSEVVSELLKVRHGWLIVEVFLPEKCQPEFKTMLGEKEASVEIVLNLYPTKKDVKAKAIKVRVLKAYSVL